MRVGILGYGRFGAAFARIVEAAGGRVRVHDPHVEVPAAISAPLVEACAAEIVVVAVPVSEVRVVVEALRPHLAPSTLVLDVASVKVLPEQALRAVLGAEIPWVATHPLFGPVSLARGEPLRVVVCPNDLHPGAAERAKAFYERLGCAVLLEGAEAHDRAMAETHAVAFFVAKGIVDAGLAANVPFAPPSFQALERTVEVVRADAGHLFSAIQRENPFAAAARARLLEALAEVDRTLPAFEEPAPTQPRETPPALVETRAAIDDLDRELVALLARRAELSRRALAAKAAVGAGTHDPEREARLLEARAAWGEALGLAAADVDDVFRAVLRFSKRVQGKAGGSP